MRARLSVPLLHSIAVLGYVAMGTLIFIATARDFHLTAFIGGFFLCTFGHDITRLFGTSKGDRS
jgi:hypothetical protein